MLINRTFSGVNIDEVTSYVVVYTKICIGEIPLLIERHRGGLF